MLRVRTSAYIDECRAKVAKDLAAYRKFVKASAADDAAVAAFAPVFFNNLVFALDGFFLHRQRSVEGKDGNPINEVRVLCASLLGNGSKMGSDSTIKMDPSKSVLGYAPGDTISLTEKDFKALSGAYFDEVVRRYASAGR